MTIEFYSYKKLPPLFSPLKRLTPKKETTPQTTQTTSTTQDKIVTFRLSQEWYDKLKVLGERKKFSVIVKEGLELWENEVSK